MKFRVIGAGLAGVEAAWQIANKGYKVSLYEMKPIKKSEAHKSDFFCELVCSNSLKASRIESAAGLLKEEMARLGSLTVPVFRQAVRWRLTGIFFLPVLLKKSNHIPILK